MALITVDAAAILYQQRTGNPISTRQIIAYMQTGQLKSYLEYVGFSRPQLRVDSVEVNQFIEIRPKTTCGCVSPLRIACRRCGPQLSGDTQL